MVLEYGCHPIRRPPGRLRLFGKTPLVRVFWYNTRMKVRLSVLIVSFGRPELLGRCVGAVRRFLPEAQVVVVDNGSEPPLTMPEGVTPVRSPRNLGFAGGNNLGFSACEGEQILLLNNDALLPSAEPVRILQAGLDTYPNAGALQATLALPDGTLDTCGEYLMPPGLLYHHGYRLPPGSHAERPHPVFGCKAACVLLRRSAVEEAGGLFRPDFFCYYEDIDLCHRLWLAGWTCWYVPTPPVLHDEGSTSRTLPTRRVWRQYLSNMLTSALDLRETRFWFTWGPLFLLIVLAGGLRHGVLPRPRRSPMTFVRRRREREFLPRITVRPTLRHLLALATRRFNTLPPLSPER